MIYILLSTTLQAQENNAKYTYSSGVELFGGIILRHHEDMGHLIKGNPSGVRLNFSRYSYGAKAWEQRYGYPVFTTLLSYYDLKNDAALGKIVALNAGLGFHLNDITTSKNDWQFYFGFGLAYVTKPYDPVSNSKNNIISTYVPWNFDLRLSYDRQVFSRIKIGAVVQISHFSNASRKLPNYGLNIPNINLAVKYLLPAPVPEYKIDKLGEKKFSKKSYINLDFRVGRAELRPIGSGASPYYAAGVFWNKQVNAKSIIDAGIEGFANKAIEKNILLNAPLVDGEPDYRSLGLMVGHELVLRKLTLVTQLGFYLYKPYQPADKTYFKVGVKYYFTEHVYASLILKTHYAIAEVLEYGIGIRF